MERHDKEKRLTNIPMTSKDKCRLVKRRLREAGLPPDLSPHSFRVTTITDLLDQQLSLEDGTSPGTRLRTVPRLPTPFSVRW
jgi:hypothetical protein